MQFKLKCLDLHFWQAITGRRLYDKSYRMAVIFEKQPVL